MVHIMVLEYLYPLKLIERNPLYAFLLGLGYAIIAIGASVILFPEDPALVCVAFISIMFYPTINSLMKQEEEIEAEKEEFNLLVFFRDHQYIIKVYVAAFLGILLAFSIFAIMLPSLASNHIFQNQLDVLYNLTGRSGAAAFNLPLLKGIFSNNLSVLILCFLTAFLLGDGAIFLLAWNASVWGTIFGTIAKNAALKGAAVGWSVCRTPLNCFMFIMLIVFAHMIIEAFSYMSAATAGGTISRAFVKEQLFSTRFRYLLVNTMMLIIFSLLVLVIGAIVETLVLTNSDLYRLIVQQSFL